MSGIKLYYEIHGKGQPIVFIAGFSVDHNAWMSVVQEFAKTHQVIVFDNRGVGRSDCPDYHYTSKMMIEDVITLMQKLKIDSAHFVGSSFGGCIAQEIAYKHPKLVKSIVLVNSIYKISPRLKLQVELRLKFMQANVPEEIIVEDGCVWLFSNNFLSKTKEIKKLIKCSLANPCPTTEVGYKNQLAALLSFDSSKWMHKIKMPCLVITADDDLLVDVEQSERLAATIPNSEYYCFKGVGHVPFVEEPKLFSKVVLDFIVRNE